MESILENIIRLKRNEVTAKRRAGIYTLYEKTIPSVGHTSVSMKAALQKSDTGIIAEFKRRSPSRQEIRPCADPARIVKGYADAGASVCSILTDTPFFGGSTADLAIARNSCDLPLLRKEFIIDPGQIHEARVFGADAVLLIAATLSASEIKELSGTAHDIGIEVLLEIHNESEIDKIPSGIDLIGINNRDLSRFKTDLSTSFRLYPRLPEEAVKVSESGIHSAEQILQLRQAGFRGFLMGQAFMEKENPAETLKVLIQSLKSSYYE